MGLCRQTPNWDTFHEAEERAQQSLDPVDWFGCDPGPYYGNQAFQEDNLGADEQVCELPPEEQVCELPPEEQVCELPPEEQVCELPPEEQAPAPRYGLDAYDVVPDDFVGPLGPNQIRQSEHDELSNFDFGSFNVVGDDFVGPLQAGQMRQSDYASLQSAWLRMGQGQGLALNGSAEDQTTFKHMLRDGMTGSTEFQQLFRDVAGDTAHTVTADLGRSQEDIKVDAFEYRASETDAAKRSGQRGVQTIDLDDYEAMPGAAPIDHPNAQTRTQKLIHALTEAHEGVGSTEADASARYHASHEAAIDAENRYRAEQGQGGQRGYDDPHSIPGGQRGDWRYDFENGFVEDWDWTGTRLDGISYREAP